MTEITYREKKKVRHRKKKHGNFMYLVLGLIFFFTGKIFIIYAFTTAPIPLCVIVGLALIVAGLFLLFESRSKPNVKKD